MNCPNCGVGGTAEAARLCATCGFSFVRQSAEPRYGTFLRRVAANAIDVAAITLVITPLSLLLYPPRNFEEVKSEFQLLSDLEMFPRMAGMMVYAYLLQFVYQTIMTCSPWQGSVGKRLLGLRVVDRSYRRLSLPHAALREAFRFASMIPMQLGFLWILRDQQRRGFHDLLAGTLVLHDKPQAVPSPLAPMVRQPIAPPPLPRRD